MLRVIINDQIKCFPFESLKEAEDHEKLISRGVDNYCQIAKLIPNSVEGFSEDCKPLYILLRNRKNRSGFYDKDSYVFYSSETPYYEILTK